MKFRIWCDEYHAGAEDGRVIDENSPCVAIEKWAERRDQQSAEYRIASGNTVVVHVKDEETGQYYGEYEVVGEAVPTYHAKWVRDLSQTKDPA